METWSRILILKTAFHDKMSHSYCLPWKSKMYPKLGNRSPQRPKPPRQQNYPQHPGILKISREMPLQTASTDSGMSHTASPLGLGWTSGFALTRYGGCIEFCHGTVISPLFSNSKTMRMFWYRGMPRSRSDDCPMPKFNTATISCYWESGSSPEALKARCVTFRCRSG